MFRDAIAKNQQSSPEYSDIEHRYNGLSARIQDAINKANRKSSDNISL